MLSIAWLSQLACKKSLWSEFDPSRQIWIVSDLKSKNFLTRSLLEKSDLVGGEPVRRASELWREILQGVDPEFKILGRLGSKILARNFLLENGKSEWCSRPRAPQRLVDVCQALSQIITHGRSEE